MELEPLTYAPIRFDGETWLDVKVWELLYHYQQLGRIE